jgi:hypothetical protein
VQLVAELTIFQNVLPLVEAGIRCGDESSRNCGRLRQ